MGSCERLSEPGCELLPVIVAGGGAEVGIEEDGVVQSVSETETETDCCVDLGNELGTLGVGDLNMGDGFLAIPEVESDIENGVKGSDLKYGHADGSEAVLCDLFGERLQEFVVDPLSSLGVSSQGPKSEKDLVVQSSLEVDCYLDDLDHEDEVCSLEENDGNFTGRCQSALEGLNIDSVDICASAASVEGDSKQITERPDATCERSNGDIDDANVSSIECSLRRVCFDGVQCESELDLHQRSETEIHHTKVTEDHVPSEMQQVDGAQCKSELDLRQCKSETEMHHTKVTGEDLEPSEMQQVDGVQYKSELDLHQCNNETEIHHTKVTGENQEPSEMQQIAGSHSGFLTQHVPDSSPSCGNPLPEIKLLELVSDSKHAGPVYDRDPKSLIKSRSEIVVAAHNIDDIVESSNHEVDCGNGSARTNYERSESKKSDTSLSLRRSSRSRKTVQQVRGEKLPIKVSKKASKSSLDRMLDFLPEATRKKRSYLSKSMCSSGWGLPENLSKHFEWSKEFFENQVLDDGKPEMKAGQRSRKKSTVKVGASSQLAEERQTLPCRPIRLKVTFGKKEENNTPTGFQPGSDDHNSVSVPDIEKSRANVMDATVTEMLTLVKGSSPTSKVQFRGTNSEICSMSGKYSHSDSFQAESEKPGSLYSGKFLDPGTSPDSEVIDQVGDSSVLPSALPDNSDHKNLIEKNNSDNNMAISISGSLMSFPASSQSSKKKRNKKKKLGEAQSVGVECQNSPQSGEKSKKEELWQKSYDTFCIEGMDAPTEIHPSSTSGSGSELVSMELSVADEGSIKAPSLNNSTGSNVSCRMIGIESTDSGNSNHLITPAETHQKGNSKGSKTKSKLKNQPKIANSKRNQKESSGLRKGNKKMANKREVRKTVIVVEEHLDRCSPGAGNMELVDVVKSDTSSRLESLNLSSPALPPNGATEQTLPPRVAWVCCDECQKWRCIPAQLADVIEETNRRWTCKDNQDQTFAECSIPQEKSNAEINADLQISDEEDGRDGHLGSKSSGIGHPGDLQQSTWMLIKSNLFLHRSRKTQTMDEIMVCQCKPPSDGTLGCGSQCLNRMLNIECVHGTCPCGDRCSNQQFQQRLYADLSWFRCGRKGYGLQVLDDISEGQFLIEYVGEVLDLRSYEARQKEYALKGHKHFYFMTLNGNEVIDACSKGNLGRFVNHSCDPNCRTEKWVVNGEICVGLFAQRTIRKGEELTFDYNYVRVFGAAAKKCYCGSLKCRGYIGGDPLNADVVVQGESDDEFPEPVALDENGEIDHTLEKNNVHTSSKQNAQLVLEGDKLCELNSEVMPESKTVNATENCSINVISQLINSAEKVAVDEVCESSNKVTPLEANKEKNDPISAVQLLISTPDNSISSSISSELEALPIVSTVSKTLPGSVDLSDKMPEIVTAEAEQPLPKAHRRMKISRPSKVTKNRKSSSITTSDEKALLTAQSLKSQVLSSKTKKSAEGSANGRLEGVEEKLNELLDADGGICKKKDASKGYLKLLLLTAASGDSGNGGAIQSNRELSMILDAFLKTKSRGVLFDIISKNGLQMLHNMLKLFRKDFKKTPILRKLLKVLEFLAEKEILSVELIIDDSLRPGVESFRESILNLTEHEDKKVHQTARNFRDQWIPRPLRNKYNVMDKCDRKREFSRNSNNNRFGAYHPWREHVARMPDTTEYTKQSPNNMVDTKMQEAFSPQLTDFQSIGSRPRKRKSRWDQPADPASARQCKEQRTGSPDIIKASPKPEVGIGGESVSSERNMTDDSMENSEDDAPPGFSCLHNSEGAPPGFSSSPSAQNLCSMECPSVVSLGLLQERFNPRRPVAYGIPFSILQQFGTLKPGTADSWAIAPAFPFQPFPPLPPYPRDKRARLQSCPGDGVMINRSCEEVRQENHLHSDAQRGPGIPSTSSPSMPHAQNSDSASQNMMHHGRGSWNGPNKRHQRLKNLRLPWFRNFEGRGFKGNHPRNRAVDRSLETVAYEQNGQHLADVDHSVECAGNSF